MRHKIALILLFFCTPIYSQEHFSDIKTEITKFDLFSFDKISSVNNKKVFVEFVSNETKDDFIRKSKIEMSHLDYFQNKDEITYEDLKYAYKNNFLNRKSLWNRYYAYEWKEGKNLEFLITYSQETALPIKGAGIYVFHVFDKDNVYVIRISDNLILDEPNTEYDKLDSIFVFKNGQKMDENKGLEQTQGYYCKNEKSVKEFYDMLKKKDKSLPESAIKFQEAKMLIENILMKY